MAAQSIGRTMGILVVLDQYLWLTLIDMKGAKKVILLNALPEKRLLQRFLLTVAVARCTA